MAVRSTGPFVAMTWQLSTSLDLSMWAPVKKGNGTDAAL